ncbi:glycohydrolase toxin TNT-related protein [Acetivibrio saccincola]|nr:glycohydrolase toxin TNT-related protein [Acetivibrio saccincola]
MTNKKSDGSIMDTYTYKYDTAGNQTEKVEVINGVNKGKTTYTYDKLNRLKTVTEPNGRVTEYTYDASGNRETETIRYNGETIVNTYENNEQNRLLRVVTRVNGSVTETTVYTYDNNGNQLAATTNGINVQSNTYDEKNQLIKTVAGGKTVINTYNGEGLRVAKSVNGSLTRYLYEYDKVILEVNGSGNQIARNLYGINLLMRTVDGESYYYMYNGHADVTALVNAATGEVAATYYYDAFGNILESTGDVNNNITYAGYQYDEETGLYYLNARMYDPKIARFLQEDTYRGDPMDPLNLNLYAYGHNNPITYYDPTGHAINLVSGAIGAGLGFLIGAGSSIVVDAFKGEFSGRNWKRYLGAGAQGAVVGGTAGLTMGGSLVATAAVGVASGAVGNVANQTIRNSGFKDFSVKELVVSTVASGVGFGAGKLVSSAAANVTSNISSQAMQQTAQGAIVGGAAGASGSIAANVTGQVFDLARGKTDDGKAKENFDFGSLAKDTLIGGITGAAAGAAFGYGNSKFRTKINELDEKVNNSIKQTTNKVIDAAKRILKDESGSVMFGGKGNNTGVGSNTPKAEIVDKNNRTFAGDKGTRSTQWVDEAGNIKWPPNNGFDGTPTTKTLKPGTIVDRYGGETGKFVSPKGTPYTNRSLPPGSDARPYNVYEVVKPIDVQSGKIAPWFDQPGGGIQYQFPQSIEELIRSGHLRRLP